MGVKYWKKGGLQYFDISELFPFLPSREFRLQNREKSEEQVRKVFELRSVSLSSNYLGLLHESYPAHRLRMLVLDSDCERESVLPEGVEPEAQLLPGLGHRHQVSSELHEVWFALQNLDVAGFRNLLK